MVGRRRHSRPVTRPGAPTVPWAASACLFLLVLLALLPHGAHAQDSETSRESGGSNLSSEVYGHVVEQGGGDAIGQASVLFRRLVEDSVIDSVSTTTGDDGAFRFERLPPGTYALVTRHLSFETRRDTFRVPTSKNMELRIPLATAPVELSPLEVTVRAGWLVETGFYRRRDRGFGRFLTPEELERRPVNSLTQALKTVPGVESGRICDGGFCREALRMSLSAGRTACRLTYYMDGDEMHGPVSPKDISVQDLAAIEVYRGISETPPQFYGRCGSVVMWSKRSGG